MAQLENSPSGTPQELHAKLLPLIEHFFDDDRFVFGLAVIVGPDGKVHQRIMEPEEVCSSGEVLANIYRGVVADFGLKTLTIGIPVSRVPTGTHRPDIPNAYRLLTVSSSQAPITTLWRVKMELDGTCIACRPVSKSDMQRLGFDMVPAGWATLFPECPVVPEAVVGRAGYYLTTYVEVAGAKPDPSYQGY
jgi:hypothetical protein